MTTPSEEYREIPLTQGQVAKVSPHRFEELNQYRWWTLKRRGHATFYAATTLKGGRKMYMHRMVLGLAFGDKRMADHINRDGLDNRDSNLRFATPSQNCHNATTRIDNGSGFKGVSFHKRDKRFQAYIHADRVYKHLGYFGTAEEAHAAYCEAAKRLHGEFYPV